MQRMVPWTRVDFHPGTSGQQPALWVAAAPRYRIVGYRARMRTQLLLIFILTGCPPPTTGTQVTLTSPTVTTVYLTFGSDSAIRAASWSSFFAVTAPLACNFVLTGSKTLPNAAGAYLNMTLAFGAPVGCGVTKAELNVNNPKWYDTMDVSLVDGYSNTVEIDYTPPGGNTIKLAPNGQTDNAKALGVYPYGCDLCVENSMGTCGIPIGSAGCKGGTQYNPDVACQYQGAVMSGGGTLAVILR